MKLCKKCENTVYTRLQMDALCPVCGTKTLIYREREDNKSFLCGVCKREYIVKYWYQLKTVKKN